MKISELWLKNIKMRAKFEAKLFIEDMTEIADSENIDSKWFIEEVIQNIRKEIGMNEP